MSQLTRNALFLEACSFGSLPRVICFLRAGVDVNYKSHTNRNRAIHLASQGHCEIVSLLIECGCDVDARGENGNTALHYAAMRGHTKIVKSLIDAGCDINAANDVGWTALHSAAYWCFPSTVQCLLDHSCDINLLNKYGRSALHEVCRSTSSRDAELAAISQGLIQAGCDVNAKGCNETGLADFTPLIFATFHGHIEVVRTLIDTGRCSLTAQDSNGWTALHWASERDFTEIVRLLLISNADASTENNQEETAIDRAHSKRTRALFFALSDSDLHLDSPVECNNNADQQPAVVNGGYVVPEITVTSD